MKLGKMKYKAVDFLKKSTETGVKQGSLGIWTGGFLIIFGMMYVMAVTPIVLGLSALEVSDTTIIMLMLAYTCGEDMVKAVVEKVMQKVLDKVWNIEWFLGDDILEARYGDVDRIFCKLFKSYGLIRGLRNYENEDYLNRLISSGIDVNIQDENGDTPLLLACRRNVRSMTKMLIEMGADVNEKDRYGQTPLLYACSQRNDSIVKILLEHGADVNEKDRYGGTPLRYACVLKCHNIAKMLACRGAKLEPVLEYFEFLCKKELFPRHGNKVEYCNTMAVMIDGYLASNRRKFDSVVKIGSLSNKQVEEGLKAIVELNKTNKLLDEFKCSMKEKRIYNETFKEKFCDWKNELICQYVRILTAHKAIRNRANRGDCVSENKSRQNLEVVAQRDNKAVLECVNNINSHNRVHPTSKMNVSL